MSRHIEKIEIFDFDGTLCHSPENTQENRALWESKTGREWPYKGNGWWTKVETLDFNVFDIRLNEEVAKEAIKSIEDPNTYTVLLTGRVPAFSGYVKEICRLNGISNYFQAYFFNDMYDTLKFKLKKMEYLKSEFPHAKNFVMWEDRVEHIPHFQEWGKLNYGKGFIMNIIKI